MPNDHAPKKIRILLVDDDELVARSEQEMLERLGYSVTLRTDSTEALMVFNKNPQAFDLVVTDQIMPKITGSRLALEIMRARPAIPIILVTGYSDAVGESQAKALGIRVLLRKPFGLEDLSDAIKRIIGPGSLSSASPDG